MFATLLVNILGLLSFLFVLWKRLREDYHYEKIFSLGFYVLLFFLISLLISRYFLPDFWFWAEFVGIALGFGIGVKRQNMRLWESYEAVFVGFLIWLVIIFLTDSVVNRQLSSFLAFWVSLTCVSIFFFFENFYRRFSWYKSGRVGFSGLATTGIFFLIRSLVALLNLPVISFVGSWEGIISGSVSFISFLLLFNLSRQK